MGELSTAETPLWEMCLQSMIRYGSILILICSINASLPQRGAMTTVGHGLRSISSGLTLCFSIHPDSGLSCKRSLHHNLSAMQLRPTFSTTESIFCITTTSPQPHPHIGTEIPLLRILLSKSRLKHHSIKVQITSWSPDYAAESYNLRSG